jgi:uncharacterized protein YutE (UPF0331/DUF86 family)
MDTLTFISEILKTVTWPIVTVIIFFALREPISNAINFLDRLKYKDLELEFGKKVKALVKEAKEELPKPAKADKNRDRLRKVAKVSPRSAILEAWLLVEDAALNKLAQKKAKLSSKDKNYPIKIGRALLENEVLDEQKKIIFNKLRNLRNAAAHAVDFSFDEESALEYIDAAILLANFLRE